MIHWRSRNTTYPFLRGRWFKPCGTPDTLSIVFMVNECICGTRRFKRNDFLFLHRSSVVVLYGPLSLRPKSGAPTRTHAHTRHDLLSDWGLSSSLLLPWTAANCPWLGETWLGRQLRWDGPTSRQWKHNSSSNQINLTSISFCALVRLFSLRCSGTLNSASAAGKVWRSLDSFEKWLKATEMFWPISGICSKI